MMKPMFFALTMCLVRLVFSQINSDQELNRGIILNRMKELGSKTFSSGFYTTGAVENQFLVAAVITDSMLKDPKLLQLTRGCPITRDQIEEQVFWNTSMICATTAVVFNRVDEQIWKRSKWANNGAYKGHSWHGEYMFLWEGIYETLTNRFKAIGSNEPCQTFLYSYFIPFNYNSQIQPYKCTEELLHDIIPKDKCPITVIGYTSAHPATAKNLNPTKRKLRGGYNLIHVVNNKSKKKDSDQFVISTQVKNYAQKQTATFQEVFYDCLSSSSIKFCCIDSTKNNDKRDEVFAIYVNKVVKKFAKTSKFSGCRGKISDLDSYRKEVAEKDFLELATKRLSNDCKACSQDHLKLYVNYCTKKAFDMTDFFGTPDYYPAPPRPARPVWTRYEDIWQNTYTRVKKIKTNVALCIRDLSPESLCTATPSKIPKLEEDRDD